MKNVFICPFCKRKYITKEGKEALYNHMEEDHRDELNGLPAAQVYFNFTNRYALTKAFGKSILSGKPTKFNLTTEKYERLANEKEREEYRKLFLSRMRKVYGKDTLLDDPEQQKKMLANRKISGVYEWRNGEKTTYTGSFEKNFLEHLDFDLNWNLPSDIMGPAPMIFPYKKNGEEHFYIPDFYIQSLNLVISIKSSNNMHYRLRDIETEMLEDQAVIASKKFNYIKVFDNDFRDFDKLLDEIKETEENSKIFIKL